MHNNRQTHFSMENGVLFAAQLKDIYLIRIN